MLLAAVVGLSLGVLGGGGSILAVPIFKYVLGLDAHRAVAASLFVVGATSLAALVPQVRRGRVRFRTGLIFGIAGMVGAFVAGRLAKHLPAGMVLVLFAGVMVLTAVAMIRGRRAPRTPTGSEHLPIAKSILLGLGVGVVSGTVGAGGGFLIVPALALLGGLPMSAAVGTSLLVIAMNSLAGFAGYVTSTPMNWAMLLPITGVSIVGSVIGSAIATRVAQEKLRRGFGWFVMVMAAFILVQELPHLFGVHLAMHNFTPLPALLGGAIIGLSASLFLLTHGKVAGISGLFGGLFLGDGRDAGGRAHRGWFLAGLVLAGAVLRIVRPDSFTASPVALGAIAVAGVLVGFGTRMANGCTSGHGVCGVSRLSPRSLAATVTFIAAGAVSVFLNRHIFGGLQ